MMRRKEKRALNKFFLDSRKFGPYAQQLVLGFCEARKTEETEFSLDARNLFRRSIGISGEFAEYVESFLADKPWLTEPTDEDIEDFHRKLTWREKMKMLLA
ncbi:hypothetical protein COV93_01615 [Candidatus Woesearchaeota archaeon CG11_big_fil_rev_8_21_14_0_20_43_8]|nr:MAG: hypothetical protein COV93_01615 [Candidatus Woesearchaeota archaeon CG11_big_fil_rev_8_21_14_0_20_43_8]PIO06570.1 MAG: hypothetical protein COT47_03295 [Candidatus Woesearchaeota archaeon CG08_land_8_20_14_0_20_43_7]